MISIDVNGTPYEVPSSAADTNWAAQQVAWEQAVSSLATVNRERIGDLETDVGNLSTLEWTEMTPLTNGWGTQGGGETPRYAIQPNGVVWVVASISGDTITGAAIYTLPVPAGSGKAALVTIESTGVVSVVATLGSTTEEIGTGTHICISFPTTTVS